MGRRCSMLGGRGYVLVACTLLTLPILTSPVRAQYTFHKFSDTNQLQPGNPPNLFTAFRPPTAERTVAFYGNSVSTYGSGLNQQGLYQGSATIPLPPLSIVADTDAPFPNDPPNNYAFIQGADMGGGGITFYGRASGITARTGIFANLGGGLQTVAQVGTFVPGTGSLTLMNDNPKTDGATVAFRAFFGAAVQGIFRSTGGVITKVMDSNTLVPGGVQPIRVISTAHISGARTVFAGEETGNINSRIYGDNGGSLSILVNQGDVAPGGGFFNRFSQSGVSQLDLDITNANLAFRADTTVGSGVYLRTAAGALSLIANTATLQPGSATPFAAFQDVTIYGSDVAFLGSGGRSGYEGLFVKFSSSANVEKVLARGELLDGKTVFEIGSPVLYDTSIAFRVTFTDNSQGVFVARLPSVGGAAAPEPTTLLLVGLTLPCLMTGKRRRYSKSFSITT